MEIKSKQKFKVEKNVIPESAKNNTLNEEFVQNGSMGVNNIELFLSLPLEELVSHESSWLDLETLWVKDFVTQFEYKNFEQLEKGLDSCFCKSMITLEVFKKYDSNIKKYCQFLYEYCYFMSVGVNEISLEEVVISFSELKNIVDKLSDSHTTGSSDKNKNKQTLAALNTKSLNEKVELFFDNTSYFDSNYTKERIIPYQIFFVYLQILPITKSKSSKREEQDIGIFMLNEFSAKKLPTIILPAVKTANSLTFTFAQIYYKYNVNMLEPETRKENIFETFLKKKMKNKPSAILTELSKVFHYKNTVGVTVFLQDKLYEFSFIKTAQKYYYDGTFYSKWGKGNFAKIMSILRIVKDLPLFFLGSGIIDDYIEILEKMYQLIYINKNKKSEEKIIEELKLILKELYVDVDLLFMNTNFLNLLNRTLSKRALPKSKQSDLLSDIIALWGYIVNSSCQVFIEQFYFCCNLWKLLLSGKDFYVKNDKTEEDASTKAQEPNITDDESIYLDDYEITYHKSFLNKASNELMAKHMRQNFFKNENRRISDFLTNCEFSKALDKKMDGRVIIFVFPHNSTKIANHQNSVQKCGCFLNSIAILEDGYTIIAVEKIRLCGSATGAVGCLYTPKPDKAGFFHGGKARAQNSVLRFCHAVLSSTSAN